MADNLVSNGVFQKIFEVMEDIEYRRITTIEDFENIAALRSLAFDARTVYSSKLGDNAVDKMDFTPNAYVYGMYYMGELVSTIRLHVLSRQNPYSNSLRLFPQNLQPLVDQGMTFIDSTRFAVNEEISHTVPGLPLLTLRIPMMAMTHFNADAGLALIKQEHAAFYRRVFRATSLTGPGEFPEFAIPLVVMQSPQANTADTCARYPVFYSTAGERRLMFEKPGQQLPALTVLPTAKYALQEAAA